MEPGSRRNSQQTPWTWAQPQPYLAKVHGKPSLKISPSSSLSSETKTDEKTYVHHKYSKLFLHLQTKEMNGNSPSILYGRKGGRLESRPGLEMTMLIFRNSSRNGFPQVYFWIDWMNHCWSGYPLDRIIISSIITRWNLNQKESLPRSPGPGYTWSANMQTSNTQALPWPDSKPPHCSEEGGRAGFHALKCQGED